MSAGALGIDREPTREEFQILFNSSPNGVLVVTRSGVIALANARAEIQFGYAHGELTGGSIDSLISESFRRGRSFLQVALARQSWTEGDDRPNELVALRKDGSEFPVQIGLDRITTDSGYLLMVTVVDLTARRRAQERISSAEAERDDLRRRFIEAQEQERLRLARELHDETGQSLTAALLELKEIEPFVHDDSRHRLRLLRGQLEGIGKTMHRIAWELRPASLDELGLANALANYVSEWSSQYGIEADFHCADENIDELPDNIRTTIYRITQEGLTNVAKHALGATSVSVVIERVEQSIRLVIDDDGRGFDTAQSISTVAQSGGLGLAGMRERLALVGGNLDIESELGSGTTLFARIPLADARQRPSPVRTRVILADDHPIVLNGLRNLIRAEPDLDLVGEAATGRAALRLVHEKGADIVVADVSMPDMNGIVLSRRLAEEAPAVRLLVLTLHEERAFVKQALDAGARGYVLKRSAAEILIQAIRAVVTGGLYVDPAVAYRLFDSETRRKPGASGAASLTLTDREAEVLKLVSLGYSTKEIAHRIAVGIKSIETYKSRGMDKLALKTRAELVRFASAQGWLSDL